MNSQSASGGARNTIFKGTVNVEAASGRFESRGWKLRLCVGLRLTAHGIAPRQGKAASSRRTPYYGTAAVLSPFSGLRALGHVFRALPDPAGIALARWAFDGKRRSGVWPL